MKYINNNLLDRVWVNHLIFVTLVGNNKNLDFKTIMNQIKVIHSRFKDIFTVYKLTTMEEFDVEIHTYQYLKGDVLPNDSYNKRYELLRKYKSISYSTQKWLNNKLNLEEKEFFTQFLLSPLSYDSRDFSFQKLAKEQAQTTRKDDTDAIVPNLPKIRTEANFRWNQMKRLREAFQKTIESSNKRVSSPIRIS